MANGKLNYFRHDIDAHNHPRMVEMVRRYGKGTYYHYFVLISICSRQALLHPVIPRNLNFIDTR